MFSCQKMCNNKHATLLEVGELAYGFSSSASVLTMVSSSKGFAASSSTPRAEQS